MSFVVSSNLRVHEVTHTGLYPYRCSLCDKEFAQLGHIQRHIPKHHGSFDKHVLNSDIIVRQHGKGTRISKEKKQTKEERDQEEYSTDYYEASNSINSL